MRPSFHWAKQIHCHIMYTALPQHGIVHCIRNRIHVHAFVIRTCVFMYSGNSLKEIGTPLIRTVSEVPIVYKSTSEICKDTSLMRTHTFFSSLCLCMVSTVERFHCCWYIHVRTYMYMLVSCCEFSFVAWRMRGKITTTASSIGFH